MRCIKLLVCLAVLAPVAYGAADLSIKEDTTYYNRKCMRILTPWGKLLFENSPPPHSTGSGNSSGFKGVLDNEGNDWVSANHGWIKGGDRVWRGFPNATDNDFGHASRGSNSTNTVTKNTPDHIIINSKNATMEFNYHFFKSHAAIEVIKAGQNYCFLWEATNGGSIEASNDYHVFANENGKKRYAGGSNGVPDIPEEWLYFGDSKLKSKFLMGKYPDDNLLDENWRNVNTYELYSFGRGATSGNPWGPRTLTGTSNYFVYTFVDTAKTHTEMKALITALFAKPYEPLGGTPAVAVPSASVAKAPFSVSAAHRTVRVNIPAGVTAQAQLFSPCGARVSNATADYAGMAFAVPGPGMYLLRVKSGAQSHSFKVNVH